MTAGAIMQRAMPARATPMTMPESIGASAARAHRHGVQPHTGRRDGEARSARSAGAPGRWHQPARGAARQPKKGLRRPFSVLAAGYCITGFEMRGYRRAPLVYPFSGATRGADRRHQWPGSQAIPRNGRPLTRHRRRQRRPGPHYLLRPTELAQGRGGLVRPCRPGKAQR